MTAQAASEYLHPALRFTGGGKALPLVQSLLRDERTARRDVRTPIGRGGVGRTAVGVAR
jgi:hypothetical protein